ncbi:corrinoid protein-associated methyltransferase CpaM [Thermococcus sp.]|uniref:corrinoid protein-associated methyltransferase CpaM n=1 Tax=Thermococcus sp. TaxID=35749 RepID=UPI00261C2163|nr:corrinoid protein-associated methyltransferase CpaM [Thermococcus sp.]
MPSYVLMRILESSPDRYDRGIGILTLGRLEGVYERLTSRIKPGQRVLDIGCGTGALTIRATMRGARVKAIDINPWMLEIAGKKVEEVALTHRVELCEMGVAELDTEAAESYDAVMAGLCFSELSEDELRYALREIMRILKPGGLLLIADEVVPRSPLKRVITLLIRLPLLLIAYLLTQITTGAIKNLPEKVEGAGFIMESMRLSRMEDFVEIVARKPGR